MSSAMDGVLMRKEDATVVTLFTKLCRVTSRESFSASSLLLGISRREKVLRTGWKAVTACNRSSSGREIVEDLMIVVRWLLCINWLVADDLEDCDCLALGSWVNPTVQYSHVST